MPDSETKPEFRTVSVRLPGRTIDQLTALGLIDDALRLDEITGLQEDLAAAEAEGFVPNALAVALDAKKRSGTHTLGDEVRDALEWYVDQRRTAPGFADEVAAVRSRIRRQAELEDTL